MIMREIKDEMTRTERLNAFCDGVFAIAITLLVLELKLPETMHVTNSHELSKALLGILPAVVSYFISFLVIGSYWSVHNRISMYLEKCDRRLTMKTLRFLFLVSMLPFTTHLVGSYGNIELAFSLYALNVTLCGLSAFDIWKYSVRHSELTKGTISNSVANYYSRRLLITPAVFFLSIPVSFLNINFARYMWVLILLANPLIEKSAALVARFKGPKEA